MFDLGYWIYVFIPGLIIGIYAQAKLSSTYRKYVRIPAQSGTTGAQAAREILDRAGLSGMPIREVPGHLTDHYDPTRKQLCLSSENYHGRSLAALGVAAHEAGHALQHKAAYAPLKLRMMMVPATQIATQAWMGIIILGIFLGQVTFFLQIAIGIFAVIALFQIITLPVEYDASRRAKEQLLAVGLIGRQETAGVSKVLNAAALTYVAAMITSVLTLVYLIMASRR